MDSETARELIALIDKKIATLQRSKSEIINLVKKEKTQMDLSISKEPTSTPLDNASNLTKQVYQATLSLGKSASPKEIIDRLRKNGVDTPDSRVRQILMRWKGRLFRSPQRGVWRAIKYE